MQNFNPEKYVKQIVNWKPAEGGRGELIVTIGYGVVFFLSVLAAYMTVNHVASWFLFRADSIWMEEYLRDWIIDGSDMRTWNTPGAPNFYPEMLVYGIFRFLTGSVYWAFVGYGLVAIAFYVFVVYKILSFVTELSLTRKLWFAVLLVSGMQFAFILLGSQFQVMRMLDFWQPFTTGAHGGAITNSLISILILLYWFRNGQKGFWWLAILFIHSILASLSDRLYLVWFSLPALGSMFALLLLRRTSWSRVILLIASLFIADLIGRKIFLWLVPLQIFPYKFSLMAGLYATLKFYYVLFKDGWYHPLVIVSYFCLLVFGGIILWKTRLSIKSQTQKEFNTPKTSKLFLLVFAILGLPVSFLAIILMNRPETQYFTGGNLLALSFWTFSLVMTPFGLKLWARGLFHAIIILTLFGYALLLAVNSPAPLRTLLIPASPYSRLIACLDNRASELGKNGVADYWQARIINLFSKKGLHIDQAQGAELAIFQWASDQEMFVEKKRTFVITDTPTNLRPIRERDVKAIYGEPDNRIKCGGFPVLIYKDGIQVTLPINIRMQKFLNREIDKLVLKNGDLWTDVGKFQGTALYSNGRAGWLEFGPYVNLPEGTYRVEWVGELVSSEVDEIGTVDVTFETGSKILARKVVDRDSISSSPDGRLAVLQFTLDQETPLTQFRFIVHDGVLLKIDEVVVTLIR